MKWLKHTLIWGFVVAGLVDLITALFALDSGRETNPIFLLGGAWPLIIGKLLLLGLVLWVGYKAKFSYEFTYYLFVGFLVFGGMTQAWGASTNIEYLEYRDYYDTQPIPSDAEMKEYYTSNVNARYWSPLLSALLVFVLYGWTREDVLIRNRFR